MHAFMSTPTLLHCQVQHLDTWPQLLHSPPVVQPYSPLVPLAPSLPCSLGQRHEAAAGAGKGEPGDFSFYCSQRIGGSGAHVTAQRLYINFSWAAFGFQASSWTVLTQITNQSGACLYYLTKFSAGESCWFDSYGD